MSNPMPVVESGDRQQVLGSQYGFSEVLRKPTVFHSFNLFFETFWHNIYTDLTILILNVKR
jgi:hypothetical protein